MNYQVLLSQMLEGTLMSLRIFFSTLLFSLPLGLLVALGRMSKNPIINLPVRFYILVMRGTPLMLQLLFIFYGLKPIFGIQLDRVISAQVAFALNYAAYFAEIFRGGIEGIPQGQHEAAKVLGFTKKLPNCFAAGGQADHPADGQRVHHIGQRYIAGPGDRRGRIAAHYGKLGVLGGRHDPIPDRGYFLSGDEWHRDALLYSGRKAPQLLPLGGEGPWRYYRRNKFERALMEMKY